jgi:predicted enzyme related to lactoylglutathione lyase
MKPKIKAIYLAVKDMNRAVKFYEEIFNVKVSSFDKRMSSFEFDNITLLLFDPSVDNEKVAIGNNVVPNIEVEDINQMLEFVKSKDCKIVMPLENIDKYLIFQIEDTEGNVLEFYQEEKGN